MPTDDYTIKHLHKDLTDSLPAYMRPYLLRVLRDNEEIPYTASQKPIKAEMLKRFFGVSDFWNAEKLAPGVQIWCENFPLGGRFDRIIAKPWDWATWQTSG
ncbi:hypothetical protein BDV25DRAFT_138901 [Aspergillus avenaceus]|uniref:Uncharacterized protein n=1 Tax=Aspergillus avenaceus TaxID=36643 RepID=A0A5N6TYC1_ASPAV|nr:hypothetical protein BDV25DRAFT_138901 [Aspergillus avenaceus]